MAKRTESEVWECMEVVSYMENDNSCYFHLYSNWYNNYAKKKYGDDYKLNKEQKTWCAEQALKLLNEWGLRNVRKGSKLREHENGTLGTRDNIRVYL